MLLAGLAWLPMGALFLYLDRGTRADDAVPGGVGLALLIGGVMLIGTALLPQRPPKRFEDELP